MGLFNIFDIAGSGMSAQTTRLNTTASNLANADTVADSEEKAYKGRHPVFRAVLEGLNEEQAGTRVKVEQITESEAPAQMRYMPHHPMANEQGYVFGSNVNAIEEMSNMISASRSYQNNVEVLNTSKDLLLKTLNLGK